MIEVDYYRTPFPATCPVLTEITVYIGVTSPIPFAEDAALAHWGYNAAAGTLTLSSLDTNTRDETIYTVRIRGSISDNEGNTYDSEYVEIVHTEWPDCTLEDIVDAGNFPETLDWQVQDAAIL